MDWHARYQQQASWTRDLRTYIYSRMGLTSSARALEVGCGTGAILAEWESPAALHGVDLRLAAVQAAQIHAPRARLACADAYSLPYPAQSFDLVFCHFLLLWLPDPQRALQEMRRVIRVDGHLVAFAEPDYSRRVDAPAALAPLGRWQREALRQQGAEPDVGGRVAELFFRAGLELVETGAITSSAGAAWDEDAWRLEWDVLLSDLRGRIPAERIREMKAADKIARQNESRRLHIPTYYAWGKRSQP